MKIKKLLVLLTLLSAFVLTACEQIPYEYSWCIYSCDYQNSSEIIGIYIKFRPDGTLEFKDIEGNVHNGTFVFDNDNEDYNLIMNINNKDIQGDIRDPFLPGTSLTFKFKGKLYEFGEDENIDYEYNFPIIDEIKDLYGDKSDGLIDITDNNPVLTKFEYYYDVYINMKKYESYENKSLNYANINNVYGIYYVIESTWENAKPIDLYENVIYYDILNKNTMTIVELREGPCVVTSTNDILEVYYFDNYTE